MATVNSIPVLPSTVDDGRESGMVMYPLLPTSMQLFHPTENQLILKEKALYYYLVVVAVAVLLCWPIGSGLARTVGATVIHCDRHMGNGIDCTRTKTGYWGMLALETESFPGVTQATAIHETYLSQDGVYTYDLHSVAVSTDNGMLKLIEPPSMVAGVRGDPLEMAAIAEQINFYLQSETAGFKLKLASGEGWLNGAIALWTLLMMTGFLGMALTCFKPRVTTLDTSHGVLDIRQQEMIGGIEHQFTSSRFIQVLVVEQIVRHRKGHRVRYVSQLFEDANRPIMLSYHCHLFEAERLTQLTQQFLGLSTASNTRLQLPSPGPTPFRLSQTVLEGDRHCYITAGLTQLPDVELDRIQVIDQVLRTLGFQFLGDLRFGRLDIVNLYGYANPAHQTYAVISKSFPKTLRALDLYSTFVSGASLTTTTRWLLFRHFPKRQCYRYCHPKADVPSLWQYHQRRQQAMTRWSGRPRSVGASLRALALAIDEYLVRQPWH